MKTATDDFNAALGLHEAGSFALAQDTVDD
jgi:hypothetical protein